MYEIYMQSGRSSSRYRQKQRVLDKNVEKPPPKTCCLHYHQWYSPVDSTTRSLGPCLPHFWSFFSTVTSISSLCHSFKSLGPDGRVWLNQSHCLPPRDKLLEDSSPHSGRHGPTSHRSWHFPQRGRLLSAGLQNMANVPYSR